MNITKRGGHTCTKVTKVMVDPNNRREAKAKHIWINGTLVSLEKQNRYGEDTGEVHGMNTIERGGKTLIEVTRVMADPTNGREAIEKNNMINCAWVAMN